MTPEVDGKGDEPLLGEVPAVGDVDLLETVAPWLKTSTEWHLLDTKWALKPVIAQVRQKPEFLRKIDTESSDHVFL